MLSGLWRVGGGHVLVVKEVQEEVGYHCPLDMLLQHNDIIHLGGNHLEGVPLLRSKGMLVKQEKQITQAFTYSTV